MLISRKRVSVFIIANLLLLLPIKTFCQDFEGIFTGKIKCSYRKNKYRLATNESNAILFIYKSVHDFYYIKYQEFDGRELTTEWYGKGKYYTNTDRFDFRNNIIITKVNKLNESIYKGYLDADGQLNGWGFDFSVADQVGAGLGYGCTKSILLRNNSMKDKFKEFIAEIQPFIKADEWQVTNMGEVELKYRIDSNNRRRYKIDSDSEWEMLGYHADNYNNRIWLFAPSPLRCDNLSSLLFITSRRSEVPSEQELRFALAIADPARAISDPSIKNTPYYTNHLDCPIPQQFTYRIYNQFSEGNQYRKKVNSYTIGYTLNKFDFFQGEMPDLKRTNFQCGQLSAMLDLYAHTINVNAPDEAYFKNHFTDFNCVIEEIKETLLPALQGDRPDILITTMAANKVIQRNILDYKHDYQLTTDLDAAVQQTPPSERMDFSNLGISEYKILEDIHYGLFDLARQELAERVLSSSAFTYYLINYQSTYPEFMSPAAKRVPVKYTATLKKQFGLDETLKEEDYIFYIDPEYEESFSKNIQSLIALDSWNGLLFLTGNSATKILNDMSIINEFYYPESRAAKRFKENLFRYVNHYQPYSPQDASLKKPDFVVNGVLTGSTVITIDQFLSYEPYKADAQKNDLKGEILKCSYKTSNGNTYNRYFWYKQVPAGLKEKLDNLMSGNPIAVHVGPPLEKAPEDLRTAIKIIIDDLYR